MPKFTIQGFNVFFFRVNLGRRVLRLVSRETQRARVDTKPLVGGGNNWIAPPGFPDGTGLTNHYIQWRDVRHGPIEVDDGPVQVLHFVWVQTTITHSDYVLPPHSTCHHVRRPRHHVRRPRDEGRGYRDGGCEEWQRRELDVSFLVLGVLRKTRSQASQRRPKDSGAPFIRDCNERSFGTI